MRTIFFKHEGPLIKAQAGNMEISDLNPEVNITWRVTRGELWRMG